MALPVAPAPRSLGSLAPRRLAVGFLAFSGALAGLVALPVPWPVTAVVLGAVALGTLAAMVTGLRANAPARRGPFEVLLLGVALLMAGSFLRLADHTLGVLGPGRALRGDVVVLVGSVVVAFAFSVLARAPYPDGRANLDTVLEGLVAGLSAFALGWVYVVAPAVSGTDAGNFERGALPIPAALGIYTLVVALIGIGPRAPRAGAARALVAAAGLLSLADGLYLAADVGRPVPHRLLAAAFVLAAGCFGASFLHPTVRRLFGGRFQPPAAAARVRDRLVAVVLAPAVLAMVGLTGPPRPAEERVALGVFGALTVCLAAWRVGRAVRTSALREAALLYDVAHDPLTGLGNRTLVERTISVALAEGARAGEHVAVVFLDLDRFKLVNEGHSYSSGDRLLVEVGERLTRTFGRRGVVARVGGDEFVVVVYPVGGGLAARREAELAHGALAAPFDLYGEELSVSASVGVAVGSGAEPTADAESLLRDADTAMYQAKGSGRDMVTLFDDSMRDRIADRLALEHDLRLAIEREEFRLAFQPIVTLGEGEPTVAGLEALLRWDRPTRGLVPASVFIECAEAGGLLTEIGDWVIRESARWLALWRRLPGAEGLFVSVNVSALHLKSHNLSARIRRVLAETGLDPAALCVELAEPTLMERPTEGVGLVVGLRDLGVRLAVDDFGNGYASLAHLRQFPVDYVKIDRRFIEGLGGEDSTEVSLVAAIVAMARDIDAVTVAEGVEHELQERVLRELGCELAQGFFYARPVPGDEVVPTLRAISPRQGLRLVTGDGGVGRPGR